MTHTNIFVNMCSFSWLICATMLMSIISFELIFVYGTKVKIKDSSFPCGYLVFRHLFWKYYPLLPPLNYFSSLLKFDWPYMCVSFWAFYSVLLIYMTILIPIPHCVDHFSFTVSLTLFVFFCLQWVFHSPRSSTFHINFTIRF